ncbi:MAG TPA: 1,2-phenylacetyl-CoA epoxidase subunit PaaD [Woeseiaceae bacterium]
MSGGRVVQAANRWLRKEEVLHWLEDVADPEIPVLSVVDLGVVRDVRVHRDGVEVLITPTYSGCPAMEVIEERVQEALARRGVTPTVRRVLSPPWTTDWMSGAGRRKLAQYGIVPPRAPAHRDHPIACPRCASTETTRISEFGSTPCKAAWRCNACREPFEQFKCI